MVGVEQSRGEARERRMVWSLEPFCAVRNVRRKVERVERSCLCVFPGITRYARPASRSVAKGLLGARENKRRVRRRSGGVRSRNVGGDKWALDVDVDVDENRALGVMERFLLPGTRVAVLWSRSF